jgi:hypothetical protein
MEHKHEWMGTGRLSCNCGAEAVRTSSGRLVVVTRCPSPEAPSYDWPPSAPREGNWWITSVSGTVAFKRCH